MYSKFSNKDKVNKRYNNKNYRIKLNYYYVRNGFYIEDSLLKDNESELFNI